MSMNAMSDNAFWALIVSVIAGCVTVLFLGLAAANVIVTTRYIDAGYTKKSLPGQPSSEWVKEAK